MPSVSLKNVAAGTANCLDGLEFQDIPPGGAIITIYASTPTAGGTIDYKVGRETFLNLAQINIETSADRVSTDTDMVLFREPVPEGKQFLSVNTQIANVLVIIEEA
tara:strand:+ start:403 stop:720 length:318 start_codon:yes stop_codon:yes gene_type:complete